MKKLLYAVIGVAILCIAFAIWYAGRSEVSPAQSAATSTIQAAHVSQYPDAPPKKPARTPPAGYAEYRNEFYWFQIFYPTSLSLSAYPQPGSAETFVFENTADTRGFQVFIVPYAGTSVSAQRFALDEPSGVMASSTQIAIDGVAGESFYGKDATIGPTFELWFINDGFLYEVSAPAAQDAWLTQIMQSWQFL